MAPLCRNLPWRMLRRLTIITVCWCFLFFFALHFKTQLSGNNLLSGLRNHKDGGATPPSPLDSPPKGSSADWANLNDLIPQIDRSPTKKELQLALMLEERVASVPVTLWMKKRYPITSHNATCAYFPQLWEMKFNNEYWQHLQTSDGANIYLYGAYYDNRIGAIKNNLPVVRLTAMIDRLHPPPIVCQLWYESLKVPVFAPASYRYMWMDKWGNNKDGYLQPYLISCEIPAYVRLLVPNSVSLVEHPCDNATTNVKVFNRRPVHKGHFAVCVKGLDFQHEDISVRLVEWLELLSLLGAEKVFLYNLSVHSNITKVLKFYEQTGQVEVSPLSLPGDQLNFPEFLRLYQNTRMVNKRQNELIPYNDCLYKNLYSYEFLVLLDIDEVPMPVGDFSSWLDMMQAVKKEAQSVTSRPLSSYCARNVYFFDGLLGNNWSKDIPQFMHMLQHVYRAKNFTAPNQFVKCFHDPQRVLVLHNHFPLACVSSANGRSSCLEYPINISIAQLQHYRKDCTIHIRDSCKEYLKSTVKDTSIWRYRLPLIDKTVNVLKHLGYFNSV